MWLPCCSHCLGRKFHCLMSNHGSPNNSLTHLNTLTSETPPLFSINRSYYHRKVFWRRQTPFIKKLQFFALDSATHVALIPGEGISKQGLPNQERSSCRRESKNDETAPIVSKAMPAPRNGPHILDTASGCSSSFPLSTGSPNPSHLPTQ